MSPSASTVLILAIELIVSASLILPWGIGTIGYADFPSGTTTLSEHTPIIIVGDSNFTASNGIASGDGSPDNPFVIENWRISASGGFGILIENTTSHFIVRNVSVNQTGSEHSDVAIYLRNVCDGIIEHSEVRCAHHSTGILLYNTSRIVVANTTVTGTDPEYSGPDTYGIHMFQSLNAKLVNNTILDTGMGITIWWDTSSLVTNNYIADSVYAIHIGLPNLQSVILGNTLRHNYKGIVCVSFHLTTSTARSMAQPSSQIKIYHNNFLDKNGSFAIADERTQWDNGYPDGGNFWSDYAGTDNHSGSNQKSPGSDGLGDVPYIIDGSKDRYPLMDPFNSTWKGASAPLQGAALSTLEVSVIVISIVSVCVIASVVVFIFLRRTGPDRMSKRPPRSP
jgi:parallel beta-helix repeat protein